MDFVKRQLNWRVAVVIAIIAVMGFYVYPAIKYEYFYDGEMVLLNGIYHKDKCDFIKDVKTLRLSPNAYWAVASGHRPCNSCKPPYVTQKEETEIGELKQKELSKPTITTKSNAKENLEKSRKEFEDFMIRSNNLSKVVIAGKSSKRSSFEFTVTCTVKNNDTISHSVIVKAVYYDKDNVPIFSQSSLSKSINKGQTEGFEINTFTNVEQIHNYELKIE